MSQNPLLIKSAMPFKAVPLDQIKPEHFLPALEERIEQARQRLDRIRTATDKPTFENTILEFERAGEEVSFVASIFGVFSGVNITDELHAVAEKIDPRLSEFGTEIFQDEKLYARVKAVFDSSEATGERARIVEQIHRNFVRKGAALAPDRKKRLGEIDIKLTELHNAFGKNALKHRNSFELWLTAEDIDGLPENFLIGARDQAKKRGREDAWLVTLDHASGLPFLRRSTRRDLREKVDRAMWSVANCADYDNKPNVIEIVKLRDERAKLLGYEDHAQYVLENRMAETRETVQDFLKKLDDTARPLALKERKRLEDLARENGLEGEFKRCDWHFHSDLLKRRLYDFDPEDLKPYFSLDYVLEGFTSLIKRLFGLSFHPQHELPKIDKETRVFDVRDENDRHLGLVYLDLFPRDTKRSGAWCTSLLKQGEFRGEMRRPQAYIAASFSPPTDGRPSLLAWGEVKTLFHELGHALHDILSDCESQTTSGTSVLWDFVELPSQFMEYWLVQPAVLQSFARHYETGEPIPTNLIKAVRESENYLASVVCLDGANFARLDMDYHTVDPATLTDVEAFESERFSDWRIVPHPEGSCFSCSFQHIFLGGYSAGMYSYQWAEVLAADAFEYFQQNGLFNEEIAKSYRDNILKKGNSQHPMDLYKAFRGREPDPDAYFRVKGMI